jgi:hypothetical protein
MRGVSLDHFIGDGEKVWRHSEAKRLRRVEIDCQCLSRRRLDGQISRFVPFENTRDISTCLA